MVDNKRFQSIKIKKTLIMLPTKSNQLKIAIEFIDRGFWTNVGITIQYGMIVKLRYIVALVKKTLKL